MSQQCYPVGFSFKIISIFYNLIIVTKPFDHRIIELFARYVGVTNVIIDVLRVFVSRDIEWMKNETFSSIEFQFSRTKSG